MDWNLLVEVASALGIFSFFSKYLIDRHVERRDETQYLLYWLTAASTLPSCADAPPKPEIRRLRPSLYPFIQKVDSWASFVRILDQKGIEAFTREPIENGLVSAVRSLAEELEIPEEIRPEVIRASVEAGRCKWQEKTEQLANDWLRVTREIMRIYAQEGAALCTELLGGKRLSESAITMRFDDADARAVRLWNERRAGRAQGEVETSTLAGADAQIPSSTPE